VQGFEAERYIDAIPADRVVQYHLAVTGRSPRHLRSEPPLVAGRGRTED